ncbi:MAG: glycosyltransferase [bacterium]
MVAAATAANTRLIDMNIAFHTLSPPPVIPGTDAAFQDIQTLQSVFGGTILHLFPLRHPTRWFPKPMYGLHRLNDISRLDRSHDMHFVSYATLYAFPYLAIVNKPLCYQVLGSLDGARPPPSWLKNKLKFLLVNTAHDAEVARSWGITGVHCIPPGIDTSRFTPSPPPPSEPFTLLAGSAPWTTEQFRLKGFDILLDLIARQPDMRLILLWRGYVRKTLDSLVASKQLTDRVEILDCFVNVNDVLTRAHAAVVLAASPRIVKAYPHSLLEALAAGRPVILSAVLPMSDYVTTHQCGTIVKELTLTDLSAAVSRMRHDYDRLARGAGEAGRHFDRAAMVLRYKELFV